MELIHHPRFIARAEPQHKIAIQTFQPAHLGGAQIHVHQLIARSIWARHLKICDPGAPAATADPVAVAASAADQGVVTAGGHQRVLAIATIEPIVTAAALQFIVAAMA